MTTPITRGISETDVWQAADALLLEGLRPTIERVRNKIGRGSPNTVSPYLETWFKRLGARIVDPAAFSAPPALPDPISQAAAHFWEAALAAARAENAATLAAGRAELAQSHRDLDDERALVLAAAAKSEAQRQAKEEALEVMRGCAEEFQHRVDELSAEVDLAGATINALRLEITRLQSDRDALRRQFDAERSAFESARQEHDARTAAHETRWAEEVDRAREATKAALARAAQFEKDSAVRINQLTRSLEDAERERRRIADVNAQLEIDTDRLRAERTAAAQALEESQRHAQSRETQLLVQVDRFQTQLGDVLEQLAIKDREHGELLRSLIADARSPSRPESKPQ
jgi:chromosome segregation ATPase